MGRYFFVSADEEIWRLLSRQLRGKEVRVPCGWRKGCPISYRDWKLLVKYGAAGKTVYIHKNKRIDYRSILKQK